jgi:uncharacterized protein
VVREKLYWVEYTLQILFHFSKVFHAPVFMVTLWWHSAWFGQLAAVVHAGACGGHQRYYQRSDLPHAVPRSDRAWRWAFVVGLVGAGAVMAVLTAQPQVAQRPVLLLVAAGLLVGYGTVTGSGCTSGHGVCGLGRRSLRSLAATLVFMGLGMATVAIAKVLVA